MMRRPYLRTGLWLWLLSQAAPAAAELSILSESEEEPGLFRSSNSDVDEGNACMAGDDPAGALAAYDKAAKSLPHAGGVHLNRGLALLATGKVAESREALKLATQPPAPRSVRADAHYNLGNAFYKEGDGLAGQDQHGPAQARFREAVDAFKQALRLKPGDEAAAWNLQLATRRLNEEQEKQEQQDQDQDQQEQQQDQQEQQQDQDQDQDQQEQQQDPQEQQQDQDQDQDPQEQQQDPPQDPNQQDPQRPDQQPSEPEKPSKEEAAPPSEVERALDALQDGEENLQRYRARQQAGRERRTPEKNW